MCNNTLAHRGNVINNVRVNNAFLLEILSILKVIKSSFKGTYDKQNLTPVVISYEIYEIYETCQNEMTTRVRSTMYWQVWWDLES